MKEVMTEVRTSLPALEENQYAYPVTTLESSLPYMRDCIKENFRITPVFSMPLARRVLAPEGVVIDGHHIPQGVGSISLYPGKPLAIDILTLKVSTLTSHPNLTDIRSCVQSCIPSQPRSLGR